jgi:chromosome segregation ATPase
MNRSLQRNEELIKKLQSDKQNLLNELNDNRDLNSTIENKKEQIIRQLTSCEIENDQLQSVISDMKIEIDMLRTQYSNEKAVVQSLEDVIKSLREKEFQSQIHAQERDSDFHLAKDRANISDLKVYDFNVSLSYSKKRILFLNNLGTVKVKKSLLYEHKLLD